MIVLVKLTLKQTKKDNGMVTRTRSQQRVVRIHPHIPIPVSLSSAGSLNYKLMKKKGRIKSCYYFFSHKTHHQTEV